MRRPNVTVAVNTQVTRILFERGRAVGVRTRHNGVETDYRARREVILSAGRIATPHLLQLSGVGPGDVLKSAGVDLVVDSPNVGARMLEHRCIGAPMHRCTVAQYRLRDNLGYNRMLSTPLRQNISGAKYLMTRRGPLAAPAFNVIGFFKTRPERERPDGQMLFAPFSLTPDAPGKDPGIEREPGIMGLAFVLRPTSEGALSITAADPDAPLAIKANYFHTEYDRTVGAGLLRRMRELFGADPIARRMSSESLPGDEVREDEQIVNAAIEHGRCGYHTVATCAMGPAERDVVTADLRVRGVDGLRVVDCSVMPTMVSGNLNGPIMAMAWHAADLILDA